MYNMVLHKWDIPESEQAAARFILDRIEQFHIQKAAGRPVFGDCENVAFEFFKLAFYHRVTKLLGIVCDDFYGLRDDSFATGALSLQDEHTLLGWRVEVKDA